MRILALMGGGALFAGAATLQVSLPTPLVRHFETLKATPSLTVTYTVQQIGGAPEAYKLQLSKPGVFKLTGPTGFVNSDGKTVVTYKNATKKYTEEPVTDAWLANYLKRPEATFWAGYLQKDPTLDIAAAKAGASRNILGNDTTEVDVAFKKVGSATLTFYVDKKLNVARGGLIKDAGKETLVRASAIELGKEALPVETFAFVPPAGSSKEEIVVAADFGAVKGILSANCMPCHSAQNARAGVVLATNEGILAIVTPGQSANSTLIKAVKGIGMRKMPPRGDLPAATIKQLEAWIDAGAKAN